MNLDWRLRIAAKMLLARIPVGYGFWRGLNLFRHGRMDNADYAMKVFQRHWSRYLQSGGHAGGSRVLELGPGDSLHTAIIAHAHGAAQVVLVDAVKAASREMPSYRALIEDLAARGLPVDDLRACDDVAALLGCCNASYLSGGLDSLRTVPSESIDFVFSHAVLEHVRRAEFSLHLRELRRILRPAGLMSHRIDFKDHLGGGLNNMRISSPRWESPLFAESGFYTNRLRASEVLVAMREAGFSCEVLQTDRWPLPPLARAKLAEEFAGLGEDDLCISGMDLICRVPEQNV